jgi:two-component system response regulator YesN
MSKIREALEKRDESISAKKHLLSLLEKGRRAVSDRYLARLIGGRPELPEPELLCDDLNFLQNMEFLAVICLEMDNPDHNDSGAISSDLLFLAMEEACSAVLKKQYHYTKMTTADNRIVIIMGRHDEEKLARLTRSTASEIVAFIHETSTFTASAGIGLVVRGVENIYTSYRQAVTALQHRLVAGDNGTFVFSSGEYKDLEIRLTLTKCCEDIRRDLRVGKKDDSIKTCSIFINCLSSGKLNSRQVRREIVKFVSVILDVIDEIRISRSPINGKTLSEYLYDIMDVMSLTDLEKQLYYFFDVVKETLLEKRDSFPRKKLGEIKNYIDESFTSPNLTVESVAEKFYISTGYLTKLFRVHQDQTFVEYITSRKMDRAKELLKTSELKNYEIAEELGYKDPHYFSSSFKKYFGQTPSEYKSSL